MSRHEVEGASPEAAVTEIEVRKVLCCPGGCVRQDKQDDCFVDGHKHRFTVSRKEVEQAKAILSRFHLTHRVPLGERIG
jgi:hypothetical protein